jgi:CelD/BcsL family acetyltransferase involved in cellulose biosynthesis
MKMKITVIPGRELSDDLVRAWMALQQANSDLASPYFHPEFTRIVSSVRNDVEVAVVEDSGRIAAFFPFQREGTKIGKAVGHPLSDYHGVICAPDFQFSPRELLQQCRLIAWEFDHLPASQSSFAPFLSSIEPSPQIDLAGGYEGYVKQREGAHSEHIKKIQKLMRRAETEMGPLRFVAESTDAASLETVLAWKSDQYRASGKLDLFAPGWIREAIDRMFFTRGGCAGMLSLLYAGDKLLAGHFGIRLNPIWHYWFPSYDSEFARYSPGLMLLLMMAQHAPENGVRVIDLGKGMSLYKARFMNASFPLASGSVELGAWRTFRRVAERKLRSVVSRSPLHVPVRQVLQSMRRLRTRVPVE